jgi:hypothetical protein
MCEITPVSPLMGNLVESGHPTLLAARIRIERPEARAYFNAYAQAGGRPGAARGAAPQALT